MDKDILILDIETDSVDPQKANLKYFGGYSTRTDEFFLLDYKQSDKIKSLISSHRVICGFNIKGFDLPILTRVLHQDAFKPKIIIDLWEISATRGNDGFGINNKGRLINMGIKVENYKLKTIIQALNLDDVGKGEIDYEIFKKESWTSEEIAEIEKYLKQDLILTKKLLEWYEDQFAPLKALLPQNKQRDYTHLKSSLASLSYNIICAKAGLPIEWSDRDSVTSQKIEGGHHINPRWNKVNGEIYNLDFASAYPHAIIQGNLFSHLKEGWSGDGYFNIKGSYDNKTQGKIESALKEVLNERLKAKASGDKIKAQSYKIVINALYGLTGNPTFKSLYNPTTAGDCTSIVRTWIKKLAKTLEENGFLCLYGFTDSIIVKVPEYSNKEELLFVVDEFIKNVKTIMPFPSDTFKMGIEENIKFIWFIAKNCYLYVTDKNEVKYKSTLLNTNTPQVIMNVFEDYIKKKIVSELDVNFTESELITQINHYLEQNLELAAEEYTVSSISEYKSLTSIHAQISSKYGAGKHLLIPNIAGIGIGRAVSTKKNKAVRYCSLQEFKENNLNVKDICLKQLLKHVKPFMEVKS